MAQDDSAIAQITEESADSIAEQQHLRRRLNVDTVPARHEDELDNKPFAHRRDNAPDSMTQDMKTLIAMAKFPHLPTNAPQGVQVACSQEIVKLCYSEAAKAITVFQNSASPDDVKLALLQVNTCLARNSEELSPPCLAALVQTLQLPPVPPAITNSAGWNPSMPDKSGDNRDGYGDTDDRQYRSDMRKRGQRHHNRRIRHGDGDRGDRDGGVHPLVWAFVLPFFFFGLFVATKKGLKHLRKWREQLLLSNGGGVQSEDYAPLKTQEPS